MTLAVQDRNPGVGFFIKRNIKASLQRNKRSSSKSNVEAETYKRQLIDLSELQEPKLEFDRLLSCERVADVAQAFISKAVACSSLTSLSLRNVKMQHDVMHLVRSALHSATLQQLDVTNCGLTDEAAEALLHFMKSSRLTNVQLGGNAWSSQELSRMLQACTAVTSLGLAGLGDTCFQPQSSCFVHIAAMTKLMMLHVGMFKDDAAEARKLQDTVPASTVSGKSAENKGFPAGGGSHRRALAAAEGGVPRERPQRQNVAAAGTCEAAVGQ